MRTYKGALAALESEETLLGDGKLFPRKPDLRTRLGGGVVLLPQRVSFSQCRVHLFPANCSRPAPTLARGVSEAPRGLSVLRPRGSSPPPLRPPGRGAPVSELPGGGRTRRRAGAVQGPGGGVRGQRLTRAGSAGSDLGPAPTVGRPGRGRTAGGTWREKAVSAPRGRGRLPGKRSQEPRDPAHVESRETGLPCTPESALRGLQRLPPSCHTS